MAAFPPVPPPDPIGLIKALASGVIVSGDPFFAMTVFTVVHYPSITPVIPMFATGELAIWELIVRMLFVAGFGALAGYALFWGMGSPILFPTHSTDPVPPTVDGQRVTRRRLRAGAFLLVICIWLLIQFTLQLSGLYFATFPFGKDGPLSEDARTATDIIVVIVSAAVALWVIIDTARGQDGSPVCITHMGQRANAETGGRILMWALFLVLVNAPQAVMDFVSAPPAPTLPLWATGLIALTLELLVILGFYYLMPYLYKNLTTQVFGPAESGVTWARWCIYVAVLYIVADVLYISIASTVISDWTSLATLLSGIAGAIAVMAGIAYCIRVDEARKGTKYWHIRGAPSTIPMAQNAGGTGVYVG